MPSAARNVLATIKSGVVANLSWRAARSTKLFVESSVLACRSAARHQDAAMTGNTPYGGALASKKVLGR